MPGKPQWGSEGKRRSLRLGNVADAEIDGLPGQDGRLNSKATKYCVGLKLLLMLRPRVWPIRRVLVARKESWAEAYRRVPLGKAIYRGEAPNPAAAFNTAMQGLAQNPWVANSRQCALLRAMSL
jgi:hypothetical protein